MRKTLVGVVIVGGLASLINFAYQAVVASRLEPVDFGLFAALMTLVVAISAGASSLQVVSARAVSTKRNWSSAPQLFDQVSAHAAVVGVLIALIIIIASPVIARALRVDFWIITVIAVMIPVLMVEALTLGRIQGRGSVIAVAGVGLALALMKVFTAYVALALGGGARSLIVLLLILNVIVVLAIASTARKSGSVEASLRSTWILVLVVAQTSYWALASLDIFIARVALSEGEAGLFAAAATLAKAVLFVPGLVALTTLPWAGRLYGQRKARRKVAVLTISISGVAALTTALGIVLLGPWVLANLLGPEYSDATSLLAPLAFAYLPIGLSSVLLQFHYTSDRWTYALTSLIAFVAAAVAVAFGPAQPGFYITTMAVVGVILFIALLLQGLLDKSLPSTTLEKQQAASQ